MESVSLAVYNDFIIIKKKKYNWRVFAIVFKQLEN